MQKILYLGMSDDIITPFLLYPDFDKLYIIDQSKHSYDLNVLFDGIKDILISGKTKSISCKYHKDEKNLDNVSIGGKCKIIKDRRTHNNKKWILRFMFNGKLRKLIRYEQDFFNKWPKCVKNINHIVSIYSAHWEYLVYDNADCTNIVNKKYRTYNLRNNVMEAVELPFTWTANGHCHPYFPEKLSVYNGRGQYKLMYKNECYDKNDPYSDFEYFSDIDRAEFLRRVRIESFEGNWYQKYSDFARYKRQY